MWEEVEEEKKVSYFFFADSPFFSPSQLDRLKRPNVIYLLVITKGYWFSV